MELATRHKLDRLVDETLSDLQAKVDTAEATRVAQVKLESEEAVAFDRQVDGGKVRSSRAELAKWQDEHYGDAGGPTKQQHVAAKYLPENLIVPSQARFERAVQVYNQLKPYRHALFRDYNPQRNELRPRLTPTQAWKVLQIFGISTVPPKRAILEEQATTLVQQNSDDYEEGLRAQRANEIKTQTQAPVKIPWRIPDRIDDETSRRKIYEDSKKKIRSLQKAISKLERKLESKQAKLNAMRLQQDFDRTDPAFDPGDYLNAVKSGQKCQRLEEKITELEAKVVAQTTRLRQLEQLMSWNQPRNEEQQVAGVVKRLVETVIDLQRASDVTVQSFVDTAPTMYSPAHVTRYEFVKSLNGAVRAPPAYGAEQRLSYYVDRANQKMRTASQTFGSATNHMAGNASDPMCIGMGLQPNLGDKTYHTTIQSTMNARVHVAPSMSTDEAYGAMATNRRAIQDAIGRGGDLHACGFTMTLAPTDDDGIISSVVRAIANKVAATTIETRQELETLTKEQLQDRLRKIEQQVDGNKQELIDRLVDATNADEAPCIKTGVHPLRIRPRDFEKTIEMAAKRFKKDQAKSDAIRAENEPLSPDEITRILSERRARIAEAPAPKPAATVQLRPRHVCSKDCMCDVGLGDTKTCTCVVCRRKVRDPETGLVTEMMVTPRAIVSDSDARALVADYM